MPDDKKETLTSCIGMIVIVTLLYVISLVISLNISLLTILMGCVSLFLATILLINRFCRQLYEQHVFQLYSTRAVYISFILLLLLTGAFFMYSTVDISDTTNSEKNSMVESQVFKGQSQICQEKVSYGKWTDSNCEDIPNYQSLYGPYKLSSVAVCDSSLWKWDTSLLIDCPIGRITSNKAKTIFKNKKIYLILLFVDHIINLYP